MPPTDLAQSLDARFRAQCARLDSDQPWVGRLVLRTPQKELEFFIGDAKHPDERIVDWRHPVARGFYELRAGDELELEPPFRSLEGTVESRANVKAAERRIHELTLRTESGEVVLVASDQGFVDPGEAPARRVPQVGLDDILGLLTPEQYRLITASRTQPVIIQGRAGSGKTSVALYRVSWLTWADPDAAAPPVDPSRVLLVMFNKGLSRFVRATLQRLGLDGVTLDTFHGWALAAVQCAYQGDVRVSVAKHPGRQRAVAIKKQLGLLRAIQAFVERQSAALEAWLGEKLAPYDKQGQWLDRYRALALPPARRLATLRAAARQERDRAATPREEKRLAAVYQVFVRAFTRFTLYKEELLQLLTDRELLRAHLPDVSDADLDQLATYQRALQGEGGTDRRPGPHVSFEDLAILLRLLQLKHGGLPDKNHDDKVELFDHLVVDEAQDFGAVELNVLFAAVRTRAGVTIVGDTNQKIIADADFVGWDALARELGVEGASVAELQVGHRSTAAVMRLADSLVEMASSGGRPGPRPTLTIVSPAARLSRVADLVRVAVADNPSAHVCVVFPSPSDVAEAVEPLSAALKGLPVRRGYNEAWEFGAGVTLTNFHQVKGLEFDVVIAVEPSGPLYASTKQGRKNLYTLVTRAKDALHLVSSVAVDGLLAPAVEAGLIDLDDQTDVPPLAFGDDEEEPF